MTKLVLSTSGSTSAPKLIEHSWSNIESKIQNSIKEIGLTSSDTVLNVFPSNVIAHYTISAGPAKEAGATLISTVFEPYNYLKLFRNYRPTVVALIPRHYEILSRTKSWKELDMSCVRYLIIGSQNVTQEIIDDYLSKGVKLVSNWYGMTEMPPPVFLGYNSPTFDFTPKYGYTVEFTDEGECVVNGLATGDIFDVNKKLFLRRKNAASNNTWKTDPIG
jgi:long-subunit acyl-CoA synthetase (AMP-forming)